VAETRKKKYLRGSSKMTQRKNIDSHIAAKRLDIFNELKEAKEEAELLLQALRYSQCLMEESSREQNLQSIRTHLTRVNHAVDRAGLAQSYLKDILPRLIKQMEK
jgi:hypothetical protein